MTLEHELAKRENELVLRSTLRLAVLAWQRQTALLIYEKDAEIEALRTAYRALQAENLGLRRQLMRKPVAERKAATA